MKSLKYVIVSLVLAFGFAVPAANAQDAAPRAKQGQGRGDWGARLMQGITLTADQQAAVKTIREDTQKQMQALPQEERRAKGREIMQESNKKVRDVLTPEQQKIYDENLEKMPQRGGKGAGKGGDKGGKGGKATKAGASE
jgi:Spy/CpxP family protein refolding chaperone